MPVLSCPTCGSASIVIDGPTETDVCPKLHCGGIMFRHVADVEASVAIRKAFYSVDLVAEKIAEDRSFRNALHNGVTVTADKP